MAKIIKVYYAILFHAIVGLDNLYCDWDKNKYKQVDKDIYSFGLNVLLLIEYIWIIGYVLIHVVHMYVQPQYKYFNYYIIRFKV